MNSYDGPERRRTPRTAISLAASLRERGRTAFTVRLVDLSAQGCRVDTGSDLDAGAWIWLKLPGLEPRYSRIAWSRGGFTGIEFEAPLHDAVIDALAAIDRVPTAGETLELRRISERCRSAAARLDERWEGEAVGALLALAADCERVAAAAA
ncbi:MAG TPA: PilZ domain-containing protein [Allosphingosinicella sp.]|nr:PilZ domain-containing protein [Allosphingosinicella sp.]